jgi:hypothetical protein
VHSYNYYLSSAIYVVTAVELKTPWPESASELYRPSDSRLQAKLVPTFTDRGCHMVSVTDPYGRILGFLDWNRYFFFQVAQLNCSRPTGSQKICCISSTVSKNFHDIVPFIKFIITQLSDKFLLYEIWWFTVFTKTLILDHIPGQFHL